MIETSTTFWICIICCNYALIPQSLFPFSHPFEADRASRWRGSQQTEFRDTVNNVPSPTLTSCLRLHSISPWNDCVWPLEKMNKYVQSKPEKYNCRDIRLPYLTSVCVCLCVILHVDVCVSRGVIFEAFMISRDVCYIGRGEKQYPLGNSRGKKKLALSLLFSHLFFSFSLHFTLCLCLAYGGQAPNAAMPCVL